MSATLPEDQRLHNISPKAYEHPADRAATAALAAIPMLDVVVRKLIEYGYERALRQLFLAGSVRLGPEQLPQTWADWNAVCARLDLPERYELYLTQYPVTNAAAIGTGKPLVVVNSRTIEVLEDAEIRTVLGHEAGHILSEHVLYRTALMILLNLSFARLPSMAGLPLLAVRMALLEWFRAAELSCDRAATLVNRDPLTTCRTLMVLAGGTSSCRLNLNAFIKQAQEYQDWDSGWDRLNRIQSELSTTHHYPVRRVHELMKWVQSGDYDRVLGGDFVTRDKTARAREEAAAATEFYSERFRAIFKDAGLQAQKGGEKLGDAAEKLSEWLRSREGSSESE
jgi:Zn-dependent protease with chaperone function